MKKLYLSFLLLIIGLLASAQNISVADFYLAENDLTARTHGTSVEDQNGFLCALIKVKTTERGNWAFDVGMLGVRKTEEQDSTHPAEIWVYVPFGVTQISIQHDKLGELDHYQFPCSIDKGCTYVMKLTTAKVKIFVEEQVKQQYLLFQLDPPNAILEVDDKLWSVDADGTAKQYVNFGTYTYRVRAKDYHSEVGKVTVDDPDNTKIVTVALKPDFAEVTLKVDADAEIWVNNEKKDIRSWTGKLGQGTYKIECKQAGHETTMVSKEITKEMNGETITLPTPTPIYGSLMVESTPNLATIYIDGKEMGKTPKNISQILIGQHKLRFVKDGYTEHVETVTIAQGERKLVNVEMKGVSVPSSKVQQEYKEPEIPQRIPKGSYLTLSGYSNNIEVSYGKQVNSCLKFAGGMSVRFPSMQVLPEFYVNKNHGYLLFADALIGTPRYSWSLYAKLRASFYYEHSFSYYVSDHSVAEEFHSSDVSFRLFPGVRYKNLSLEVGEFGYRMGLDEATTSEFIYDFFAFKFNYHIPLKGVAKETHPLHHYKSSGHYLRLFGGNHQIAAAYGYRFNPYLMLGGGIGNFLYSYSRYDYKYFDYGLSIFAYAKISTPGDKWSLFAQLETIYSFDYYKRKLFEESESYTISSWGIWLNPGISYKDISLSIGSIGYSSANGNITATLLRFTLAYDIPL